MAAGRGKKVGTRRGQRQPQAHAALGDLLIPNFYPGHVLFLTNLLRMHMPTPTEDTSRMGPLCVCMCARACVNTPSLIPVLALTQAHTYRG